jgi:ATP-dependent Clp protease ATP-binding subunit ClpC
LRSLREYRILLSGVIGGRMNGYNFTERVRKVLQIAREEAFELRHEYIGTEHLLLGICLEGEGVAVAALDKLDVDPTRVRDAVLEVVKPGRADASSVAAASGGILGTIADSIGMSRRDRVELPYTSRAKRALELAMSEAHDLQHSYVGTEHLLLGLLREERGIAAQILTSLGATTDLVRTEVIRLIGEVPPEAMPAAPGEKPARRLAEGQVAITLVVVHADGRIERKQFTRAEDAVSFLNRLAT